MYRKLSTFVFMLILAISIKAQKKVAVFDPTGKADETMIEIAREMVIDQIVNSGTYTLLEREKIQQVLKENAYQQGGNVDDGQISDLGKQMGADYVCVSTIQQLSERYFFSTRLVDVETAQAYVSGTGINEDLFVAVETAAKKIAPKTEIKQTIIVEETKKTTTTTVERPHSKKEKFKNKSDKYEEKDLIDEMAEKAKEINNTSSVTISIITGGNAIKEDMIDISKDCKQALSKKYTVISDYPTSFTIKGSVKNWSSDNNVNFVIKMGSASKKMVINIFNTELGRYEYIYTKIRIDQGTINMDEVVMTISNYINKYVK